MTKKTKKRILITATIDSKWDPTHEEINNIKKIFIEADKDPKGAVVTNKKKKGGYKLKNIKKRAK